MCYNWATRGHLRTCKRLIVIDVFDPVLVLEMFDALGDGHDADDLARNESNSLETEKFVGVVAEGFVLRNPFSLREPYKMRIVQLTITHLPLHEVSVISSGRRSAQDYREAYVISKIEMVSGAAMILLRDVCSVGWARGKEGKCGYRRSSTSMIFYTSCRHTSSSEQ